MDKLNLINIMEKLQLNLTVNEINLVLDALSNMPFKQISQIIQEITKQANEQLNKEKEQAK